MIQTEPTLLSVFLAWAVSAVPQIAAALAIVIAGFWLANASERVVLRLMDRQLAGDPTLRGVLGSGARYGVLLLFLIAAIGQLGFQLSSVLAVLATAGLAIGLALQATLSNIAAGLMLLWLRPFRVGDTIEVGAVAGKVIEVGLFASEIHTIDGLYQFVPNSELWNKKLTNFSRLPRRLVSVRVKLADPTVIDRLRRWLDHTTAEDVRVTKEPKPSVIVSELADDKMTVTVQAWTSTEHYQAVLRDLTDRLPDVVRGVGVDEY